MSKTFFTSDTHFGHAKIIEHCNRPFANAEEMDDGMVRRWNAVVGMDDVVWHLGDFAYKTKPAEVARIVARLNGRINFIQGNHDRATLDAYANKWLSNFYLHPMYVEEEIEGQRIVMCHYAFRTWHHDLRGVWHLYGHSHNELPPLGKSCDVGVDAWGFAPVSFERLKEFMDARPVHDAPQFANYQP